VRAKSSERRTDVFGDPPIAARVRWFRGTGPLLCVAMLALPPVLAANVDGVGKSSIPMGTRAPADGRADYLPPGSMATSSDESSSVDTISEVITADVNPGPYLESIPLQIVSPGVSVSFEIVARDSDGTVSVSIDRLPDDAVMAENGDGTHTFRWLTGPDDEGEHVFRFTAVDADGITVIGSRDAIILVGDPSLGGSYPARSATKAQ